MNENPGIQAFEIESSELLEDIEKNLLILESRPEDTEVINSIFRAAHTIKGSSGLVGFKIVEKFTHHMENVLSRVRDGELMITSELIELLLESRDHVANLIKYALNEIEPDSYMISIEKQLLAGIASVLGDENMAVAATQQEVEEGEEVVITDKSVASENWHISLRFGPNTFRSGMDPISFIHYLDEIGEVVSIATLLDNIPPLESLVYDICYLGFEIDLKTPATKKEIEDVFEFVRDDCKINILPPRAVIDRYMELIKESPEDSDMLGEILVKGGALTPFELLQALKQQVDKEGAKKPLGRILVDEGMVEGEVLDAAIEKQKIVQGAKLQETTKTIRVDIGKLDSLMNIVGEMVIAQANIMLNSNRIDDIQMSAASSVMTRLIQDIRESVNEVRMVPISNVLNRYYRTVRDICNSSGKKIELTIFGGDTEIDRSVAEKLNDPLMHLVRNAADHGIENVEDRLAADKPETGALLIEASQDAGHVVIKIADDGAGIDIEKVLAKAASMGLVQDGENLSKEEVYRLIFHAGLSTKDKTTNFSGRGVGMDVVRQNIENIRGKTEVTSEPGTGTVITLRFPLTLAIIDGFMVRVGDQKFALPLDLISECIEVPISGQVREGDRHLFRLREGMVPFIRLKEFFLMDQSNYGTYEYMVVVKHEGREVGLAVDELYGEMQIVIKALGSAYKKIKSLSGATILGDGTVAMILDVPHILHKSFETATEYINA